MLLDVFSVQTVKGLEFVFHFKSKVLLVVYIHKSRSLEEVGYQSLQMSQIPS
jgi:hypothetical protein